jgi:hypothetical protein
MKSCISKSMSSALAVACLLVSGCAYLRPSPEEFEAERLKEQETVRQQEEFKHTLGGGLLDAATHAAGSALSH